MHKMELFATQKKENKIKSWKLHETTIFAFSSTKPK